MRMEGTCGAGGATNLTGVPVPTTPVPSGRTILTDRERRHARTPTITLSAEPQPVVVKAPRVRKPTERTYDGPRWLNDHDRARITQAYEAGRTVAQIMADVGRSKNTIHRALKAAGITKRNDRADVTPDVRAVIVARWQTGESAASIARAVGVTAATVTRQLRAAGEITPAERRRRDAA